MKTQLVTALCAALGVTASAAFAGNCASQNPPLVWKISFTNNSGTAATAIFSDGVNPSEPEYVHGVGGVNTVLNVCSGSYDATLSLGNRSTRTLGLQFPASLTTSDPASAWGKFYTGSIGFNIRNLGYWNTRSNEDFEFTTRLQLMFTGPDRQTYQLIWQNPAAEADSRLNFPCTSGCVYADALVRVHHVPANAGSGTPETWIVWPDDTSTPPEVATLFKSNKGYVPVGQYRMPFKFTITRK